jgi:predicted S18 family serine protease
MTGTLLKTSGTLKLVRQDTAQAVIQLRTAYDRDSVREGLALASRQVAAQNGGTVPERLAAPIKAMENFDVQQNQTTILRLADGWADSMTMERVSVIGPERRMKRTVATRLQ